MCCHDSAAVFDESDVYLGHRTVALAFEKFLTKCSCIRFHPGNSPPKSQCLELESDSFKLASKEKEGARIDEWDPNLGLYIAHVVHECCIPNIVPYSALFLLMTVSQGPTITTTTTYPDDSVTSMSSNCHPVREGNVNGISEKISRTFGSGSPEPFQPKSHWTGEHVFVAGLLVVLDVYEHTPETPTREELSYITGLSVKEMHEMEKYVKGFVNEKLWCDVEEMIEEQSFKTLPLHGAKNPAVEDLQKKHPGTMKRWFRRPMEMKKRLVDVANEQAAKGWFELPPPPVLRESATMDL